MDVTVKELIEELKATCLSLDDQVIVCDPGIVTNVTSGRTAGTKEPAVLLNNYYPQPETR